MSDDAISRHAVIELVEGWWLGHTKEDDLSTEIKQLPSVNPIPCEDAISRQAAIDIISGIDRHFVKYIKDLPPVTPKQRAGHWIDTADEINAKYGKHDYKCSKCGKYAEYFIAGTEDWWSCEKPNYCPYCGSKMEEQA